MPYKKALMVAVIVALCAVMSGPASSIQAAPGYYVFTGVVDQSSSFFQRPWSDCTPSVGPAQFVPYEAHSFSVSAAGTYEFAVTASPSDAYGDWLDLMFFIYAGSFNPAAPTTNCIFGDDDSGGGLIPYLNVPLAAGNYVLVISHYDSFDIGANYTVTTNIPMPEGAPGCDVLMPIPATAVGGTFVADAPVYWEPGELTSPLVTIGAGNSARVIGLDAMGQYYKIIWVCDLVWVPKATMGPNYDAVWNGAPLPTEVVD